MHSQSPRMCIINPEIPDCIDMGDFGTWLWLKLLNPVGTFITQGQLASYSKYEILNPGAFKAAQIAAYDHQQSALSSAYEEVLGLPEGVPVVIYPVRVNGEPMYMASVDDTTKSGIFNSWNFTHPAVRVADLAMRTDAAKFQNYLALDIRVFTLDQVFEERYCEHRGTKARRVLTEEGAGASGRTRSFWLVGGMFHS